MSPRPLIIAAALLLSLCPSLYGECHILTPDDPIAREITAVAATFFQKLAAGDEPAAKALFAGPPDQAELLSLHLRWRTAAVPLLKALQERFGPRPEFTFFDRSMSFTTAAATVTRMPVLVNDDLACTASTGVFARETGLRLRRIDKQWRITHIAVPPYEHITRRALDSLLAGAPEMERLFKAPNATLDSTGKALIQYAMPALRLNDESLMRAPSGPNPPTRPVQPLPDALDLCGLLGKDLRSPEVTQLIASLPAIPHFTATEQALWVNSLEAGIQLNINLRGRGLLIIEVFNAGISGHLRYPGALGLALSLDASRFEVERRLGPPPESHGSMTSPYSAFYPNRGVSIDYAKAAPTDPNNTIASVSLGPPDTSAIRNTLAPRGLAFRLVLPENTPNTDSLPNPDDPTGQQTLSLSRDVIIDERHIADIHDDFDPARPDVAPISISFTPEGVQRLGKTSRDNIGRRMAIVAGGRIIVAPVIQEAVPQHVLITFNSADPATERLGARLHAMAFYLPDLQPTTRPAASTTSSK